MTCNRMVSAFIVLAVVSTYISIARTPEPGLIPLNGYHQDHLFRYTTVGVFLGLRENKSYNRACADK